MQKKMILIIDDDPLTNKFNEMIIRKLHPDIEIKTLLSAKDGLEYLADSSHTYPQLILLDLNMPIMNGWDFMDEFTRLDMKTGIILVTSSDDPYDRKRAEDYTQVKDYLVKPLSKDNLSMLFQKHFPA